MHYLTLPYAFGLSPQVLLFGVLIFIIGCMRGEAGPKHLPNTADPERSKATQSASTSQDGKENQPPMKTQQISMPRQYAPRTVLRPRSPIKDGQVLQMNTPRDRYSPKQSLAQQVETPQNKRQPVPKSNLHEQRPPQPRNNERKLLPEESPQFETRICKVKVFFDDSFVDHAADDNWRHNPTTILKKPLVSGYQSKNQLQKDLIERQKV